MSEPLMWISIPDEVEVFYAAVNKRAEADMLSGRPVTGAHHRALEHEIAAHRERRAAATTTTWTSLSQCAQCNEFMGHGHTCRTPHAHEVPVVIQELPR